VSDHNALDDQYEYELQPYCRTPMNDWKKKRFTM